MLCKSMSFVQFFIIHLWFLPNQWHPKIDNSKKSVLELWSVILTVLSYLLLDYIKQTFNFLNVSIQPCTYLSLKWRNHSSYLRGTGSVAPFFLGHCSMAIWKRHSHLFFHTEWLKSPENEFSFFIGSPGFLFLLKDLKTILSFSLLISCSFLA